MKTTAWFFAGFALLAAGFLGGSFLNAFGPVSTPIPPCTANGDDCVIPVKVATNSHFNSCSVDFNVSKLKVEPGVTVYWTLPDPLPQGGSIEFQAPGVVIGHKNNGTLTPDASPDFVGNDYGDSKSIFKWTAALTGGNHLARDYGFTVIWRRREGDDQPVLCGKVDPVIVNSF